MHRESQSSGNPNSLDDVLADYMRRVDRGEKVDREALIAANPNIAAKLREYFSQAGAIERFADGATADFAHQATPGGKLEVRCPSCHAPMEVAVDTALTDLTCGACGSHFSLVDQSKATRMAPSLSKLGRFELIERLGVGGFGSVWKARDKELDRTVAIKIPRAGDMTGDEQEKFFREARAAAQLKHPSIVSVHEVGRDGDSVYIVSDFVRGVTLGDWLTGQQLTSREAAQLCTKVADALHHAHEKGVVHRDLKPGNIMIDGDGEPHLMDFGLARREVGEVTVTVDGQIMGTPAYMSPEQAQGEAHTADRRSDVYSLGVILFQLLTGELPFRGNARMLMHQVINDEAPSPRKLNANVPRDLETITLKCLEKEPVRRYQTSKALSDEFKRFLTAEPIHARPISRIARSGRWCKRNPLAAALAMLLLILAVGGPFVAFTQAYLRRQAKSSQEQALRAVAMENQAKESLRRQLYNAEMYMAYRSWHLGDYSQTLRLLGNYSPTSNYNDIRRFEWYLLSKLCRPSRDVIHAQDISSNFEGLSAMRLFPDSRTLALGTKSGTLLIWDLLQKRELGRIAAHHDTILSIDISTNGRFLVTTSADGAIRVWDYATRQLLHNLSGYTDWVRTSSFSPDGTQLAAGGFDGAVRVWDTETGVERHIMHENDGIGSVAFSPDGKKLAVAVYNPGTVKLWRAGQYDKPLAMYAFADGITAIAFSPDSETLAVAGSIASDFGWIDLRSGQRTQPFGTPHRSRIWAVNFAPDGRTLATTSADRQIKIWGMLNDRLLLTMRGHDSFVSAAAFAGSHDRLISLGGDDTFRIWDLSDWEWKRAIGAHNRHVRAVAFAPGAKVVATTGDDGTVRTWDLASRRQIACYVGTKESGGVHCAAYIPSRDIVATGWDDGQIRLLDSNSLSLIKAYRALNHPVAAIAVCPGGSALAAADRDTRVVLFDVKNGEQLHERTSYDDYYGPNGCVAFTPNGESLLYGNVLGNEWTINKIDCRTNKGTPVRYVGPSDGINVLAVSPSGEYIAAATWGGEIRIWKVEDGAPRRDGVTRNAERIIPSRLTLIGHSADVSALCFSPDSAVLASGSTDGAVIFWDTATGEQTGGFGVGSVTCAAFAPNGMGLVTGDDDGVLHLWFADSNHEGTHVKELASDDSQSSNSRPYFDAEIDSITDPQLHELQGSIGEERTVEFTVARVVQYNRSYYLDSVENFLHPCAVRAYMNDKEFDRLRELDIKDPRGLAGRRIRVIGVIDRVRDQLWIKVEDAGRQLKMFDIDGKLLSLSEFAEPSSIRELQNSLGKRRTVTFRIKGAAFSPNFNRFFINSLENHRDPECFTVVVPKEAIDGFKTIGIQNLDTELINRTIRVVGEVVDFEGKVQIVVHDLAKQIHIIDRGLNDSDGNAIVVDPEPDSPQQDSPKSESPTNGAALDLQPNSSEPVRDDSPGQK